MKSRAWTPTVVRTSATVIETKPCLNICIDKTNVSALMSYSWRGGQDDRKPKGPVQGGGLCVLK